MNVEQLFTRLGQMKVAVVGDVMLDTYWWGHVDRISPEAPVPVVSLHKKEYRIGGAGNVALNLVALQAKTILFSVMGDDAEGNTLMQMLTDANINCGYVIKTPGRPTTNKTRIMSRNQQMMRLDTEVTDNINDELAAEMLQYFKHYLVTETPDVVVFEDYNKGVLTPAVITTMIALCKKHQVLTTVDPKRKHFFDYHGVSIFKPNLKEVYEALNILAEAPSKAFLRGVHAQLHKKLQHDISLITLSEKGIFYQQQQQSAIFPTHIRSIADVSGAGDTVIAVASLVYAATKNIDLATDVANLAGGLVCEEVGTAPINRQRLIKECILLLPKYKE